MMPYEGFSQGKNHNWLIGYDVGLFDNSCDTLGLGIYEIKHDFKYKISPNPSVGNFKISYLLPQNEKGKLEILDVNGRRVYEMNLPQWSSLQHISLPTQIASGVYNCVITSGNTRANRKVVIIN